MIEEARPWLELYKRHRPLFTRDDLPAARGPARAGLDRAPVVGSGARASARCSPSGSRTSAPAVQIPLRNVPDGREFELLRGPDATPIGIVTSRELREGLTVELPEKDTAEVLLIRPARR